MFVRLVLSVLCLLLLQSNCESAVLKRAALTETAERTRLVLELDQPVNYKINKGNAYALISLPGTAIMPAVQKNFSSRLFNSLTIQGTDEMTEISAGYKYLTSCQIVTMKNPYRIVVDFRKISKMALPRLETPEIEKIYSRSMPDKFKLVIYLTSFVPYSITTAEGGLILELPDVNSVIKSRKITTKDKLIPKVGIDQAGKSTIISLVQTYPAFYQIYKLENPSRLVIEFDKASRSTVTAKDLSTGFKYVKMIKGTDEGPSTVNALMVDQHIYSVFPYISPKEGKPPAILDTIGGLFTFWMNKDNIRYRKNTVSSMVKESQSLAGVNGTFFGDYGEPLGVLMINGELVSYSINDRTALIIDRNNNCHIDNVALSGEVSIEGSTIEISGINSKRMTGQAMVYNYRFGAETKEDTPGIVLSVQNGEVKNITRARAWIPRDGYALSLDPSYYESIGEKVRIGSKIKLTLKLTPLSSIPGLEIKHVIGGGPRLLKSGQVYISRNSEKFKSDISKSRTSRTAIGIASDGTLVFATVDKFKDPVNRSVGVTLEELAMIMKDLGCVEAMNLDGGSSSTMVVSTEVVNVPASGTELNVSNGILIKKL